VVGNEGCDAGSFSTHPGCFSNCSRNLPFYACTSGSPTSPSVCTLACGNGKRNPGETCDDGIPWDNKGCREDCIGAMTGWTCSGGTITTADTCTLNIGMVGPNLSSGDLGNTPVCGNGVVEDGE